MHADGVLSTFKTEAERRAYEIRVLMRLHQEQCEYIGEQAVKTDSHSNMVAIGWEAVPVLIGMMDELDNKSLIPLFFVLEAITDEKPYKPIPFGDKMWRHVRSEEKRAWHEWWEKCGGTSATSTTSYDTNG